jgi:hypothetical protein
VTCRSSTRDLVTFWLAGSLSPAEAALVSDHIKACAECRDAAMDGAAVVDGFRSLHLTADEIVTAASGDLNSPHLLVCPQCLDEVALLRGINSDLARSGSSRDRTPQRWLALTAAALVAIAVPLVWLVVRPTEESVAPASPIAQAPQPNRPEPAPRPRIAIEKASLAALARESVVLRGSASPRRALLDGLAQALEPYRRDDFGEALARLNALEPGHSGAVEIAYYRGVCLLLLDRPGEAVAPLQAAADRMRPADEAAYYLAVAKVNAASSPEESSAAVAGLAHICDGGSETAARACAALGRGPGDRRR